MKHLKKCDPEVARIIEQEETAQEQQLNFIASENVARPEVLEALGSVFTDTYAEGYPGRRYYSGCAQADAIEELTIKRCKELFNAEHANVQPHSGSQANMAVYLSVLEPGDTLMGMSLAAGGHLTHGHPVSFSGKLFKSVQYTVNPSTEYIDYEAVLELAQLHKPKIIVAGASAYSRIIDLEKFKSIAQDVGAYLLVDTAHIAGLIPAKVYPNPTDYADFITGTTQKTLRGPRGGFILCTEEHKVKIDRSVFPGLQGGPALNVIAAKAVAFHMVQQKEFIDSIKRAIATAQSMVRSFKELDYRVVSGGTDTHLFVIDLTNKGLTGKSAERLLEKAGILVSRSAIPFDKHPPFICSGIRFGTLAFTARGYTEKHAQEVVAVVNKLLLNPDNPEVLSDIKQVVESITKQASNIPC